MAKNEKGYPLAAAFNGSSAVEPPADTGHMTSDGGACGCGGREDCLDDKPLAYLYAPDQKFRLLYSAGDALSHGTLFEELYKPMEVYGREH